MRIDYIFYDVLHYILKYILFILQIFFLIFSWFINLLFLLLDFVKSSFIILIFFKNPFLTGQGPSHENVQRYYFFPHLL